MEGYKASALKTVSIQQSPRWQSPKVTSRRVPSSDTKPGYGELLMSCGNPVDLGGAWLRKTQPISKVGSPLINQPKALSPLLAQYRHQLHFMAEKPVAG